MREESFNYRKQLLVIYSWIQQAADELYCLGMNIAMKDELKDFNAILEDGDELPGDISYLKALKDERVVLIVQMIEELFACQNYLVNVNNLSGEDLVSLEDSDNDAGEEESSEETQDVLAAAEVEIYGVFLALFVSIWQLAHQTEEDPQEVYDQFTDNYFEASLTIESKDVNVNKLLTQLNKVLEYNARIDYC